VDSSGLRKAGTGPAGDSTSGVVGRCAGKAGHLAALAALDRLRRVLDGRIEELVAVGRGEGASWAEIGAALGVTRQTAHERL
jgi:hypothetical protein